MKIKNSKHGALGLHLITAAKVIKSEIALNWLQPDEKNFTQALLHCVDVCRGFYEFIFLSPFSTNGFMLMLPFCQVSCISFDNAELFSPAANITACFHQAPYANYY